MTANQPDCPSPIEAAERDTLTLWTIQALAGWQRAEQQGVLRADESRVFHLWHRAFRWMAEQMTRRVPAHHGGYPVWAWYYADTVPDPAGLSPGGQAGVCVEFRAPRSEVLLSSFDAWHSVVNDWYLSLDDAEEEDWVRRYPDEADPNRRSAECQAEIERSWERVFDLELLKRSPHWADRSAVVQAAVPEVRLDQVVSVRYFSAL